MRLALLALSCLYLLTTDAQSSPQVCYGQYRPICGLGMDPVCMCTGPNVLDCSYVCLPRVK